MTDERHDEGARQGSEQGTARDAGHDTAQGTAESAAQGGATVGSAGETASGKRTFTEEFQVSGERVVSKIKELIREGNVRRITLKNEEGRTLIEIPLTLGVIGTALLPVWAGIGAIAALVADLTITVEKVAEPVTSGDPRGEPAAEAGERQITAG